MSAVTLVRAGAVTVMTLSALWWSAYFLVPHFGLGYGLAYQVLALGVAVMLWNADRMRWGLVALFMVILVVMALGAWEAVGVRGATAPGQAMVSFLMVFLFLPLLFTAWEGRTQARERSDQ